MMEPPHRSLIPIERKKEKINKCIHIYVNN